VNMYSLVLAMERRDAMESEALDSVLVCVCYSLVLAMEFKLDYCLAQCQCIG
jgi:hypothetical protein